MDQEKMVSSALTRGIVYMLISTFIFSLMNVGIRWASNELHAFQIAFFRNLFGLLFMMPWLLKHGLSVLKTERMGLFWLRAVFGLISMLAFFWSLTVLPLSQAVALSFTVPIFVTIGAAVFLKEQVNWRRWLAIFTGFIGTLVILRPGTDVDLVPSLIVIGSSITMAASVLIIKDLSKTESSNTIVTYMVLMLVPLSLPPAVAVWQWPSLETWFVVLLIGSAGTVAHLLFTNALKISDVSVVMPFDFGRLLFIVFFAWLIFDQKVDYWTIAGAIIVFASGVYIAHREARVHRKKVVTNKRIAGPS